MPSCIYGRNSVIEALRAGEAIDEVLVAEGASAAGVVARIVALARERGVPLRHVPRTALDRIVGRPAADRHQGVVAVATEFAYSDVNEILAVGIRRGEAPFVLVLDAVQDVHNLGSLIRTAETAGMHGVLVSTHHAASITPAVRKIAAGAVAHLAVARTDLPRAIEALQARGVRVAGLDEDAGEAYWDAALDGALAVAVGSEGRGLSAAVARRCDLLLRLPMRGRVGSLNAAVAGSIVVYEALRQRAGRAPGTARPASEALLPPA